MTVTAECACGASLQIEDASELTSIALLQHWHETHAEHRITEEEYRIKLAAIHRRFPE